MIRAWKTKLCGITCIVAAESRSKAKYYTYLSARDADWNVKLINAIARRAPEFDAWAAQANARAVVSPETLAKGA